MKNLLKKSISLIVICFLTISMVKSEIYFDLEKSSIGEYFGSIKNNVDLFETIACNFRNIITEVSEIDIFSNEENGFYYIVKGFLNSESVQINLKVKESDIFNESYTYMNLKELHDNNETVEYCYEPVWPISPFCGTNNGCWWGYPTQKCNTIICGVFDYIGGEPYCHVY